MSPQIHTSEHSGAHVVLVGGIDPGTGAGLARDLLTAQSLGARSTLVGTAWTVQGPASRHSVEPRGAEGVASALADALAQAGTLRTAAKIGMLATASIARAVLSALADWPRPIVFDPVLRASSGGLLYDGMREIIIELARRATLLTPNLAEAAWLLGSPVQSEADARLAAKELVKLGIAAVLVKGGHLEGEATDVLCTRAGERLLSSPRIPGPSPRGTGCALATAIAVNLAGGADLEAAVRLAKTWLRERIASAQPTGSESHLPSGV